MNRKMTVALFAGIFAIAMTTVSLSGASASTMVLASTPQAQSEVSMLGHVEWTVLDENNNIKRYLQSDNLIVRGGTDCAAELIFGSDGTSCGGTGTTVRYIGIGNGSAPANIDGSETYFDDDGGGSCGSGQDGEQARKDVSTAAGSILSQVDNAGSGTVVTLDVGTNTFKFDASNATTITQSALFDDDSGAGPDANGMCQTPGTTGVDWNMFAIQNLPSGGTQVSDGDSLTVKWTITIT